MHQELRQMEMQIARPGVGPRSTTMINADTSSSQLKAELILLKRKNLRLEKKEKRIQVRFVSGSGLCSSWVVFKEKERKKMRSLLLPNPLEQGWDIVLLCIQQLEGMVTSV